MAKEYITERPYFTFGRGTPTGDPVNFGNIAGAPTGPQDLTLNFDLDTLVRASDLDPSLQCWLRSSSNSIVGLLNPSDRVVLASRDTSLAHAADRLSVPFISGQANSQVRIWGDSTSSGMGRLFLQDTTTDYSADTAALVLQRTTSGNVGIAIDNTHGTGSVYARWQQGANLNHYLVASGNDFFLAADTSSDPGDLSAANDVILRYNYDASDPTLTVYAGGKNSGLLISNTNTAKLTSNYQFEISGKASTRMKIANTTAGTGTAVVIELVPEQSGSSNTWWLTNLTDAGVTGGLNLGVWDETNNRGIMAWLDSGETAVFGDLLFVGSGAGLSYGEIYVKDNTNATTLNSAAKVQITDFSTNGASNNTTPDHTNDHITIATAGDYLVIVSIALVNVAAQAHKVEASVWVNNGSTEKGNIHGHRDMTGGGGDEGSMALSGIATFAANDTVEVWANTDAAANRNVIFEDVTVSLVQVGS